MPQRLERERERDWLPVELSSPHVEHMVLSCGLMKWFGQMIAYRLDYTQTWVITRCWNFRNLFSHISAVWFTVYFLLSLFHTLNRMDSNSQAVSLRPPLSCGWSADTGMLYFTPWWKIHSLSASTVSLRTRSLFTTNGSNEYLNVSVFSGSPDGHEPDCTVTMRRLNSEVKG